MKKTLIVIDMQNDFIDGSLGTDEAVKIMPNVRKKIEEYRSNGDEIIFTRDTHGEDYLSTPEGKKTARCALRKKILTAGRLQTDLMFPMQSILTSRHSAILIGINSALKKIELVGLCTDICVVSNALILKALFPNAEISVDSACCAGVTPETHNSALATMKMCQIDVV